MKNFVAELAQKQYRFISMLVCILRVCLEQATLINTHECGKISITVIKDYINPN